jgi:hypothetical protein
MDVTKHLNFLPSAITFKKERSSQSFVKVMDVGSTFHQNP